jgi:hypothetical protein
MSCIEAKSSSDSLHQSSFLIIVPAQHDPFIFPSTTMNNNCTSLQATCLTLCPVKEINDKLNNHTIHPLEIFPNGFNCQHKADTAQISNPNISKYDSCQIICVKSYFRGEEKDSASIRRLSVLQITLDHLLHCVLFQNGPTFPEKYNFLADRMRAIKKDAVIQSSYELHAQERPSIGHYKQLLHIYEIIFNFFTLSHYVLRGSNANFSGNSANFDAKLNSDRILDMLETIIQCYSDLFSSFALESIEIPAELTEKRDLFHSYMILYRISSSFLEIQLYLVLSTASPASKLPDILQFSLDLYTSFHSNNFYYFFSLQRRRANPIHRMILDEIQLNYRLNALKQLNSAYRGGYKLPLFALCQWLNLAELFSGNYSVYEASILARSLANLPVNRPENWSALTLLQREAADLQQTQQEQHSFLENHKEVDWSVELGRKSVELAEEIVISAYSDRISKLRTAWLESHLGQFSKQSENSMIFSWITGKF